MKIAFDFDGTLTEPRMLNLADSLKHEHELWICTFRYSPVYENGAFGISTDIFEVAALLGIPDSRILFTDFKFIKGIMLKSHNIQLFIDDCDYMVEDAHLHGIPSIQVGIKDDILIITNTIKEMGFRERLQAEAIELQEKLQNLNIFLGTEKCEGSDTTQKTLLIIQAKSMDTYLQCLEARLALL